tara:strand:- start:154 stop:459 length:306 start_codon:yes stop_codon:yes gene_type:complete
MAKITKDKLIELIQESLEEYMGGSSDEMQGADMGHGGGCPMDDEPMAEPMDEPMDLESQVAELKSMMQQLMDMMSGQQMMELQAAAGEGRQSKDKEDEEDE